MVPLPKGTRIRTSAFGMRRHLITGVYKLHSGTDFLILIEHTVAGQQVTTGYAHMTAARIMVKARDRVRAGQQISSVGSTGYATAACTTPSALTGGHDDHLHFSVEQQTSNIYRVARSCSLSSDS